LIVVSHTVILEQLVT